MTGFKYKAEKKFIQGFTLIEIMIFIVLAGILLPTLMGPFVNAILRSERPEVAATAVHLAMERLEGLYGEEYDDIADESRASVGGNFSAYERQVAVTEVRADNFAQTQGNSGYKRIDVTVYHSQIGSVSVTTLVTDYND
jgi:Tfp pilus assembly protein PilE